MAMGIRRILNPAVVACLAISVFIFIYARQITVLYFVKSQVRSAPEMWIVPKRLLDTEINHAIGQKVSWFGYEFEVPWLQMKLQRKTESMAVLTTQDGYGVLMFDPSQGSSTLQIMKQESVKQGIDVEAVFGAEATRSNYALRSKMLNLTPRDLHLFSLPREMVGDSVLLMLKTMSMGGVQSSMYSFHTEWLQGFQVGDPAHEKRVAIEAFDTNDREVQLWISVDKTSNHGLLQADINRIVYSLHSIPAPRME